MANAPYPVGPFIPLPPGVTPGAGQTWPWVPAANPGGTAVLPPPPVWQAPPGTEAFGGGPRGAQPTGHVAAPTGGSQGALVSDVERERLNPLAYANNPAYRAAYNDYRDFDNSFGEDIGNLAADALAGVYENRPDVSTAMTYQGPPNANWNFDPVTPLGHALPMGIGSMVSGLNQLTGRPASIGLGPSVFGQPDAPNYNNYMAGAGGALAAVPFNAAMIGATTGGKVTKPAGTVNAKLGGGTGKAGNSGAGLSAAAAKATQAAQSYAAGVRGKTPW